MSSSEFTGERVIPGQVDPDLWNEHLARYAFASRYVQNRRVLDAGCGTGYGAARLSLSARSVVGIDLSREAVQFAQRSCSAPNVVWASGSCEHLPFRDHSFDVVVAFEVIEHLKDWPRLIREARRVLGEGGHFVVSTPNKSFYAETRRESGPNPFHEHEFEFDEFGGALREVFPNVTMFLQDHVEAIGFRPAGNGAAGTAELEPTNSNPAESTFFIAVCSANDGQGMSPDHDDTWLFVPRAANALREKILHIERLQGELALKDRWLADQQRIHEQLVTQHRAQTAELEKNNLWAEELERKFRAAGERILALQEELDTQHKAGMEVAAGYEKQLAEITQWGQETERRLTAELQHQVSELGKCVELLHQAEATLEERTRWALQLDEERNRLDAALAGVQASRWVRLGRLAGLGPELHKS